MEDGYYWFKEDGESIWDVVQVYNGAVNFIGSSCDDRFDDLRGDWVKIEEPE